MLKGWSESESCAATAKPTGVGLELELEDEESREEGAEEVWEAGGSESDCSSGLGTTGASGAS
eukprot:8895472-Alexandrium_andersonii.AAC.1